MDERPVRRGIHKAPSPEETARNYIHTYGDYYPDDVPDLDGRRRKILLGGAIGIVVVAAAIATTVALEGPKGSHPSNASSGGGSGPDGCSARPSASSVANLKRTPLPVLAGKTLYAAQVVTTQGTFTIALDSVTEPVATNDFVYLAQHGFYHCDPLSRGAATGTVAAAASNGTSASAHTPRASVPYGAVMSKAGAQSATAANQWFVVAGKRGETQPAGYVEFGRVVVGMSVIEKIDARPTTLSASDQAGQRILKVRIVTQPAAS
jgi:cyclophilin family peptidyl-prolyl cis-trans isomerase